MYISSHKRPFAAQVELATPEHHEDSRYWQDSLSKRRLRFASEVDVGGLCPGTDGVGLSVAEGGGGGEQLAGCRTSSWEALPRWDEPGSRRGSERDLLEVLLGTAAGLGDGAVAGSPSDEGLGMRVRRWAEAASTEALTGSGPEFAAIFGSPPLHGHSLGRLADKEPGYGPLRLDDAGIALLTAQHVSRVAGLLSSAPAATPLLLPMLANTTFSSQGQAAESKVQQVGKPCLPLC